MIIKRREVGFNLRQNLSGFSFAELVYKPIVSVAFVLAAIAGLARRKHVIRSCAGAIGRNKRDEVIGTHRVPEALLVTAIGAAIAKILKSTLKIFFCEITWKTANSRSSARVFHPLCIRVRTKPCVLVSSVANSSDRIDVALFIKVTLALEVSRIVRQSVSLITTLTRKYLVPLIWIISSIVLPFRTSLSVVRIKPMLTIILAPACFALGAQAIFSTFVSIKILGSIGIFAVAFAASFRVIIGVHSESLSLCQSPAMTSSAGAFVPPNYATKYPWKRGSSE